MRLVDCAKEIGEEENLENLVKRFSCQINELKLLEIELRNYIELPKMKQEQICENINRIIRKMKRS
ncbi:MAG: hypothetical protein RSE19_06470 [Myroides sp.]